jgi:hypothetical protein
VISMNIDHLIAELADSNMDSVYENKVAKLLTNASVEEKGILLHKYLSNDDYQVRMLGLRLIKRCRIDKKLFSEITRMCFEVNRLTELQKWYSAILSRYPLSSFVEYLKEEFKKRNDMSFFERNIRALQMELANSGEKGKVYLQSLERYKPI